MDEMMIGGDPGASPFSGGQDALLDRVDHLLDIIGIQIPSVSKFLSSTELSARSLLLMLLALVLLLLLPPMMKHLLLRLKHTHANFRDEILPQSFGVVIVLFAGIMFATTARLYPTYLPQARLWIAAVLGFGLLGLLDDIKGDAKIKGLRGHFKAAFVGKITTGFVKAIGGVLLALLLAWKLHSGTAVLLVLDAALIALCANALNLLDLRPGRAGAVFLFCGVLLLVVVRSQGAFSGVPPLLFLLLPALVVYERDARGTVMLGDTGSNTLGACLGLALAQSPLPIAMRGIVVVLLLGLHLLAERVSLTKLIAEKPLLRFLDNLTGVRVTNPTKKS